MPFFSASLKQTTKNGKLVFPKIYPRFILCAAFDEQNTNLTEYEEITIRYEPQDITKKLQPLQPMLIPTPIVWPLLGYRMCSKLEIDTSTIFINWLR